MTKYKEITIDALTGKETITDYSPEQLAEAKAAEILADERLKLITKLENDKAALLAKLGITADEAALLLA